MPLVASTKHVYVRKIKFNINRMQKCLQINITGRCRRNNMINLFPQIIMAVISLRWVQFNSLLHPIKCTNLITSQPKINRRGEINRNIITWNCFCIIQLFNTPNITMLLQREKISISIYQFYLWVTTSTSTVICKSTTTYPKSTSMSILTYDPTCCTQTTKVDFSFHKVSTIECYYNI